MQLVKGDRVRAAKGFASSQLGRRHATVVGILLGGLVQIEFMQTKSKKVVMNAKPDALVLVKKQ